MNQRPIGIFDSGLGGLSVWKACKAWLPQESFLYIADQAYCPYGSKSKEEILQRCLVLTERLLAKQAKLIVVACNTATAAAIQVLRKSYPISFVGMEPALKPAAERSKSGKIGILATQGTFQGEHFRMSKAKFAQDVEVLIQVGTGLVELVESGELRGKRTHRLLRKYLEPMKAKKIDQLVLGCTHYPFLQDAIAHILGPEIPLINPAPAVAKQVQRILRAEKILATNHPQSQDLFFTTGDAKMGQSVLNKLLAFPEERIELKSLE